MTVTVAIGWWVLPCIVTALSFFAAWCATPAIKRTGSMFAGVGEAIAGALYFGVATIISLSVWLIWALAA